MVEHRTYKFLIVPVVQVVEDGTVINELTAEQPVSVFGVRGLIAYAEGFEENLRAQVDAVSNSSGPR